MHLRTARTTVLALVLSVIVLSSAAGLAAEEPSGASGPSNASGPSATSVTQTLQGESGISVQTMCTNCNSADLTIGSFGNALISMMCDGLPVPPGLAQIYLLSVLPPGEIDNVAVRKGAGLAEVDGGAVGGMIDVRRREPAEGLRIDATVDTGEYDWSGARADVSGGVGWLRGSLIGTWAESGSVDADRDGNPDMASIDRSSWEGRFELRPGERHTIEIGLAGYGESQDDGRAAYDIRGSGDLGRNVWERERVDLNRDQYDATYTLRFDDGSNLTAGLMHAERDTAIDEEQGAFSEIFSPTYDIGEERSHVRVGWFRPLGYRVALRFGASHDRQNWSVFDENYVRLHPSLPPDFLFEERLTEDGVWVEPQISFGGRVDLTLGLRWVDFTYGDNEQIAAWQAYDLPEDSAVLPRAALTWKPVNPLSLRFSAGRGLRQPPATYDSVCCGRKFRGNRGIEMERSTVYGVEATWQPKPAFQLSAAIFRSEFENHVINLVSWAEDFVPVYQNANVPQARFRDLSLETRIDPAPWVGIRASAAWIDADNRTPGDEIPVVLDYYGTPVSRPLVSDEIPYIPDRTASLSVVFRVPRQGLAFDLSAQHTGPRRIQRLVQYVFELPEFSETPSFEVYNFRASKTIESGFEIFLGVDNIGDYFQDDLADPTTDYTWGPLRGTYVYGGVTFRFERS